MAPSLAISLDALGGWRAGLARRLDELTRYLAERDLIRAHPVDRSAPVQVFRRREALSRDGGYVFIEDEVKGEIGRREVPFPSYE